MRVLPGPEGPVAVAREGSDRRDDGGDRGGLDRSHAEADVKLLLALFPAAVSIAAFLVYPVLNHGPNRIFLQTPLDRAIPLVPVMVSPYVSLIPLIITAALAAIVAVLWLRTRRRTGAAVAVWYSRRPLPRR